MYNGGTRMKAIRISPKTKDVLKLVGAGVMLTSLFIAPGVAPGMKLILDLYKEHEREKDLKEWDKYNLSRFRTMLKRLMKQKILEEKTLPNGTTILTLTQKGNLRRLKYNIEDMQLTKPPKWDGKWRIVIYDIERLKNSQRDMFRRMLRKLCMLPLQKSVYVTPYPCESELTFLRSYFDVDNGVLFFRADSIENEELIRRYFDI